MMDCHWELMMTKFLDEVHPGESLIKDFMKPMEINAHQLAADMDVLRSRMSELVHGASVLA